MAAGVAVWRCPWAVPWSCSIRMLRRRRRAWLQGDEDSHRAEAQRLRAIYDLTSTLTATLSYKRVLDVALDLSYSALNPGESAVAVDRLVGAILLFKGGRLQVEASRRFHDRGRSGCLRAARMAFSSAFLTRARRRMTFEYPKDPELSRVIAFRSCRSAYCCPLANRLQRVRGVALRASGCRLLHAGPPGCPGHHLSPVCHCRSEFPAVSGSARGKGTYGRGPRGGQEEACP